MIKFRLNPLICCMGEGQAAGGPTGGNVGDGGIGANGGSTGNIAGQLSPGNQAIKDKQTSEAFGQMEFEMQRRSDLITIAKEKGMDLTKADVEAILGNLDINDLAFMANNKSLSNLSRFGYALQANTMPNATAFGLASMAVPNFGYMATAASLMGAFQTMATGKVGAAPDPDTSQAGPSKSVFEWMNDPKAMAELKKKFPDLNTDQIQADVKKQADVAIASAFLGPKPKMGMDLNDYNQQVETLVSNWNTGKGGYDKAQEMGTPGWLSSYLTDGRIPEFFKSKDTPDKIPDATPGILDPPPVDPGFQVNQANVNKPEWEENKLDQTPLNAGILNT